MNRNQERDEIPKRSYRACYQCRSRKLKCDFGDPNDPNDGPCQRCKREGRECEKAKPTAINPSKRQRLALDRSSHSRNATSDTSTSTHHISPDMPFNFSVTSPIATMQIDSRNAVLQTYMSAQWWESVSDLVSRQVRGRGDQKVWVEDAYSQSLIACLIGTIQEHLYPNKEVTRSILRTGIWESFLRSLRLELQFIKRSCQNKLKEKGIDAVMLHIEIDYVTLYANALALRALQEKLKRRREAKDLYYSSPSLLNLIEGPWILEALSAARSIVQLTVDTLAGKGYLRYCPARIFQRVVFAATFLFKALALGVVEHGQQTVLELLNSVIEALRSNACDEQHLPRGFAELLARLHEQRQSLSTQQYDDKEVSDEQPISASSNIPVEIQSSTTTNEFALPPIPNTASTQAASDLDLPLDNLFSNFMGSQPSAGFTNVSGNIPQTGQPLVPNTSTSYQNPEQISWEFAPQLFLPAVDRDQDVMLQSLWNMDTVDPTSLNLWDTLFGDTGNAQDPVNQQSQNSL